MQLGENQLDEKNIDDDYSGVFVSLEDPEIIEKKPPNDRIIDYKLEEEGIKYCPECSTKNLMKAKFCADCGKRFAD